MVSGIRSDFVCAYLPKQNEKNNEITLSAHCNQLNHHHRSHWKVDGGIQIQIKRSINKIGEKACSRTKTKSTRG